MEKVIIIGHKAPDTDSVVNAVVLAELMGGKAARAGEINKETEFVLNKFNLPIPELVTDISGNKVLLVDHNEQTQIVDGIENAEIIGVIDHHKIQLTTSKPIYLHFEPIGSTASIIGKLYIGQLEGNPNLAGALLGALLSDTVIFKSPTTTDEDRLIAGNLAKIAGIADIQAFGLEVKKANASLKDKTTEQIVKADYKDFDMSGNSVGIGQTEIVDMGEVTEKYNDIVSYLDNAMQTDGHKAMLFAATDIINEGSELFFAGDKAIIEKAFGVSIPEGKRSVYIPGMMSRKKQIVPPLEEYFKHQ